MNTNHNQCIFLSTAEPCKFFQPKLLVDANIGEADNMDSWDIPQGAAFEPERLKAEAKHMTYINLLE